MAVGKVAATVTRGQDGEAQGYVALKYHNASSRTRCCASGGEAGSPAADNSNVIA